ncbi:MAG: sulfotransferase domain-containing protein [Pseudomonadota bacterium]|nr:sulfotransferase domain-containing protein [Pseudomonadota bacterium]
MLRRLFSDYPFFYKIYYHLVRKHRGIPPLQFTPDTNIYYDGYQRSGNTFFNHLIKNVLPGLRGVHHLHKIAPVKVALQRRIPVFILIRDPLEAIPSNYLKYYAQGGVIPDETNVNLLSKMADDYYHYYNFVNKNREKIFLIEFQELIDNPCQVLKSVADQMGIQIRSQELEEKVSEATNTYSGAKTKYGSSKPNIHKEREKDKIKKDLVNLKSFKGVTEVYQKAIN